MEQQTSGKTVFMSREQHRKWDEALRSGEYRQGFAKLKTADDGFCCLGVLQHCLTGDVERNEFGIPRGLPTAAWLEKHGISFDSRKVTGFTPFLPAFGVHADTANDRGKTFVEIADAIAEAVEYTN